MRKNLPDYKWFIGKAVPGLPDYVIDQRIDAGMNAHVFRAHSVSLRQQLACKVIPRANLVPDWEQEVIRANTIRSPAAVKYIHRTEWTNEEEGIDCVVICGELVHGLTLRRYIGQNRGNIEIKFAERFLDVLLAFLHELQGLSFGHGDLHAGNIMVEDRTGLLSDDSYSFRVLDFGVSGATQGLQSRDDYHEIAATLRELLSNVDLQNASGRDRYAFNILNDHFLARHLLETDSTRDPLCRNPRGLHSKLRSIDRLYAEDALSRMTSLTTPFDYLSCEQIGDTHALFNALYSEKFLGLRMITSRNNVVLTGPRGCGKSTVFRGLSLQHQLWQEGLSPATSYFGVYYRCDDLYYAFPRYSIPERPEALNLPIHFMTATLIGETLRLLSAWASSNETVQRLATEAEQALSKQIWELCEIEAPNDPTGLTYSALTKRMMKERRRAAEKQRVAHDPRQEFGHYFGPEVLPSFCALLREMIPPLRAVPFFFFIDDYSAPKISLGLQRNLNRLLMQRQSDCFFKLATESSVSYAKDDIDKKAYIESREFVLQDMGLVYLQADPAEKIEFIDDVFQRRFKAVVDYPVSSLPQLIGESPKISQNKLARQIADGSKPIYYGRQWLCEMCSGDIHYTIELVGRMVLTVGGRDALHGNLPLTPQVQNQAIRQQAGNFLSSLAGLSETGSRLVQVVTAFGTVAHSFIRHRQSRNEKAQPRHQASRIEPIESLGNLKPEAAKVYHDLLRYSVFIEDQRGKSRRGEVVPRLHLRRFLIPHFNLTFSKRDSVELTAQAFEDLLLNPEAFQQEKRLRRPMEDSAHTSINDLPLFSYIAEE